MNNYPFYVYSLYTDVVGKLTTQTIETPMLKINPIKIERRGFHHNLSLFLTSLKHIKRLAFFLICIAPYISQSQDISVLESKNGFRDLKLNTHVSNYPYLKKCPCDLSFRITEEFVSTILVDFSGSVFPSPNYIVDDGTENFESIPGAPILKTAVYTYNDIIYEIAIYVKANVGSSYMVTNFYSAFGYPTIAIGFAMDFKEVEENDGMLYTAWHGENISLSITSFNGNVKFRKSKRRGYIIRYSFPELEEKVREEQNKNRPNPADSY